MKPYTYKWYIERNGKIHTEAADILDIDGILAYSYSRLLTEQERKSLNSLKAGQSIGIFLDSHDFISITATVDIEEPTF